MNPIFLLKKWLQLAIDRDIAKAKAFSLSTVDKDGKPSTRMLLLNEVLNTGITFYTDERSKKIIDLKSNPFASAVMYWHPINRQVRIEGTVIKIDSVFAEEDFKSKSKEQQLIISLSDQSKPVENYRVLKKLFYEQLNDLQGTNKIEKPDYWQGYLLQINQIEFFKGEKDRLNKRVLFRIIENNKWQSVHLFP